MKYEDLKNLYLCGIGSNEVVKSFRVGTYNKDRESFCFSQGSYSHMELYREPVGSNATYVISSICLQNLDDNELLYLSLPATTRRVK